MYLSHQKVEIWAFSLINNWTISYILNTSFTHVPQPSICSDEPTQEDVESATFEIDRLFAQDDEFMDEMLKQDEEIEQGNNN